jgi:hypothetical protein
MKAHLFLIITVLTGAAIAQVRILPVSSSGILSWTNRIGPGLDEPFPNDTLPVYRVESASTITGPWSSFTNTSQTTVWLADATNSPKNFYRVVWTNGQIWSYRAYANETLIVTGKLYLSVNESYVDGGAFNVAQVGVANHGWHRIGTNTLDSCFDCQGRIFFAPYCCDNEFMLDGFNSMSTTSTGVWYYGGFGGIVEQGRFVAERLDSGK